MTGWSRLGWLVVGIAAGYGAAWFQLRMAGADSEPAPAAVASDLQPAPAMPVRRGPASPAVSVSVENPLSGEFVRAPGLLLGDERYLLMALAPIRDATTAFIEYPGGAREPVGDVVAIDVDLGLAVLATPLRDGASYESSDSSGTLYLGRDVTWKSQFGVGNGFVDSAARQTEGGNYVYALRLDDRPTAITTSTLAASRPQLAAPLALLADNGNRLIGVTLPGREGSGGVDAIDAASLRDLLASIGTIEPMNLAAFAGFYASATDVGRLERLARLVGRRDWEGAVLLARDLQSQGPPSGDARPLIERAYEGLALQQLAQGDAYATLATLDDAQRHVGQSAERMALRAAVYKALDEPDEALEWYARALRADPSLEPSLRPALRDYALSLTHRPSSSLAMSIEWMQRVLADDAGFAPYHARLGQLFFESGRYAEADASLSRALSLDPAMATELQTLQASARQRRNLPHSTDVPIDTRGNVIFLDVMVNGAGPFRFLLDTGASYTAISTETALRLGIDNTFFGAPVTALETANGRIYATVTKLQSVAVGQAAVNDVDVVILDTMGGADGLLGLSYLDHFNVDINRTVGKMSLVRR
ncbi:MAG: TIGR02281 family clan AA aspartic protease [Pseudomonadota bacterium]